MHAHTHIHTHANTHMCAHVHTLGPNLRMQALPLEKLMKRILHFHLPVNFSTSFVLSSAHQNFIAWGLRE